jgi:hypothetical protein
MLKKIVGRNQNLLGEFSTSSKYIVITEFNNQNVDRFRKQVVSCNRTAIFYLQNN